MKTYGTILVVDDNAAILTAMRYLLNGTFEQVLTLSQPDDILKLMAQKPIAMKARFQKSAKRTLRPA